VPLKANFFLGDLPMGVRGSAQQGRIEAKPNWPKWAGGADALPSLSETTAGAVDALGADRLGRRDELHTCRLKVSRGKPPGIASDQTATVGVTGGRLQERVKWRVTGLMIRHWLLAEDAAHDRTR
jgi:hypothetical protein